MRKVRVSKKFLASFGAGSAHEDDDLEFFGVEELPSPTVVTYGNFCRETVVEIWKCLWCFAERTPDERGRFARCMCGRLGVTTFEMKTVRHIYIEDCDEE